MHPLLTMFLQNGPEIMGALSGNVSNAGGVMPQNRSKFGLNLEQSMNNPNNGYSLGMDKMSLKEAGGPTDTGGHPDDPGLGGGSQEGGPKGGGGLPPWLAKIGAGLKVGEALRQEPPRPPALPGGGKGFSPNSSILQFLQSIRR